MLFNFGTTFKTKPDIFNNEKSATLLLHPRELNFLLEDLNAKLHHCFHNTPSHLKGSQKKIGFSNLESHATVKIISFCVDLLPALCTIIEDCVGFFKNIIEECDETEDSLLLFTNDSQCIMKCLNLVFKVIKEIISWKDFNLSEHISLLKKALHVFSAKLDGPVKTAPVEELIRSTIDYFKLFSEAMPSLQCAANYVEMLVSILSYADDLESKLKASDIALKFLKKKWNECSSKTVKIAEINGYVKVLLEAYLKNSKSLSESLEYLAAEGIPQVLKDDDDGKVFHTLKKSSLNCYYKIMFGNLVDFANSYFTVNHSSQELINEWSISLKIFQVLTNLVKAFESRSNVATCLKCSRGFITTFLRYGMPLMDKLFITKKDEVVCLMKTLQMSTRYLQHVCGHSKVLKDVSLIKHVPFLKKSLEIFVFRVKMMLAVNKCEEAFWLGNLKNRDIKGAEILSQQPPASDEDSENNEAVDNKDDSELSNSDSADE